jgi:hypothetical protein
MERVMFGTIMSDMAMDLDRAIRFLIERGAAGPVHNSHVTLLEHVLGTYRVLERWGFDADVCGAGLFHSVYSTQNFPIALAGYDEREIVRAVAGDGAERLAFLFCIKESTALFDLADIVAKRRAVGTGEEGPDLELRDWRGGETQTVSEREIAALLNLVAANAVEQAPRDDATLRRDLAGLLRAHTLLASEALTSRSFRTAMSA